MIGLEAVKETQEFLEKIKNTPCPTCRRVHVDLPIKRVPKPTLELFKKIAKEECCDDYGFFLKFLLDFYVGRIVDGSAIAEAKAEEALSQIAELKKNKEEKSIYAVDGRKIR